VHRLLILTFFFSSSLISQDYNPVEGLPLYYWQTKRFVNFGDYLSVKLVERIVGGQVRVCQSKDSVQKLLAIGSVLPCANSDDVVWGTGMNGKKMNPEAFRFDRLDVRAVRGPLTRAFIIEHFDIHCPEIYGDPALLLPYFFPEFKRKSEPEFDYVIVPHYSDIPLFPKEQFPCTVYPTDPWKDVIRKILNSKFVISSSLHGLVVADAYGIPARYLRVSENEPIFKYQDYYWGTNRFEFQYATSVEEALQMGGEPPCICDLEKLYNSFPFDYWPDADFIDLEEKAADPSFFQ